MPLQWSEPRPPTKDVCHYDHVGTDTPLGTITIEWKGWKDHPGYTCNLPWGDFVSGNSLDDAKTEVQAAWNRMAALVSALATT